MSPDTQRAAGDPDPVLEDLLVAALAAFDDGGNAAVETLLAQHPAHVTRLRRALADLRIADLFGDQRLAPDRLGDFRLGPQLGSGGMGVVYEAEQISLQRKVAVKVVRPELLFLDGARERFRREIDAISRLEHPAVVPILACGEVDGRPFYAMPWLRGCTADEAVRRLAGQNPTDLVGADLQRAIAQGQPAEDPDSTFAGRWWQACARLVRQIALGIAHAHRRGILHRDLKPSNVMLTPDGRAQVLDFGLALVRGDQRLTRTGSEPGTPAWMAPEQLRGAAADERTDVYGLAAILHHLLTLEPPFPIGDSEVLRSRILQGQRRPLRERNPVVPRDLAIVVAAAMDVDPDRRHATAAAFADDLLAVLQSRPIQARRLPWRHRLVRWVRRHPAWATGAAATLLFTALMPSGLWLQQRQANKALAAAKTGVDRSYDLSMAAIESLLLHVGDKRLRQLPGAQQMAAEMIEQALAFFDRLAVESPDTERVHRMRLSVTKRLFEIYLNLGDLEQLPRLTAMRMRLLDAAEPTDALRLLRVDTFTMIANQELARLQPVPAQAAIEQARALLQPPFELPEHRARERICQGQLAGLQARVCELTGDRNGAIASLRTSIAIEREVWRADPQLNSARNLASSLLNLSRALQAPNERADAVAAAQEGIDLVAGLPPDEGSWPTPGMVHARLLGRRGLIESNGEPEQAVATLTTAVAAFDVLLQRYPELLDLRGEAGGTRHNLARILFERKDLAGARVLLEAAIVDQEFVRQRRLQDPVALDHLGKHRRLHGIVLRQQRDRAALPAAAEALLALPLNGDMAQQAARSFLVAADGAPPEQAGLLLGRAMAALQEAERRGFGAGKLAEAVWQPLAELPEFKALQERLRARPDQGNR
ncbi:MAG: serine/threonine protein kinase [Planctomycetes bacterium]|nr:serine/threonine protein kinase [Planctomycetota bacterium]